MIFFEWLRSENNLSEYTAKRYSAVIENRIFEWLPGYEIPKNLVELEALKQELAYSEIFHQRNNAGHRMYSTAFNHYENYLKSFEVNIKDIVDQNKKYTAQAERLILVRLQQNRFRRSLFVIHDRCVISGYNNSQFLIASHIKPWSESDNDEKVDSYNGLLLTPNYDKLFDKNMISFSFNGSVLISKTLDDIDKKYFKIPEKIDFQFHPRHKRYLDYHNAKLESQ